jgi:hypothetical protein
LRVERQALLTLDLISKKRWLKVSKSSRRGFLVGGIAVLVLAGLVVGFRARKKAPPSFERPPAAVTLAVASAQDVPVYLDEIGKTDRRLRIPPPTPYATKI